MTPLLQGLVWLTILGVSGAQHEVTIERGPLYRTVGSHVTIWCKVSGYQGGPNQQFQFSVQLPSDPEKLINVVSTEDPNFSYAKYSGRVQSGDIYAERVSGNHTVLHITHLREEDQGEYECYTPNTASTYLGTYSANTQLIAIPNTLQVAMPRQAMETSEGASLELTCQVSMASTQHTHLSVSWILSTFWDTEILTLSRDFVLHPGATFSQRFVDGDVRLDKLSQTSYRLTIGTLGLSDQGEIFCRGSEWIQDPGGAWTKIAEKDSEKTSVKVAPVRGGDFKVKVEASAATPTPGQPLEVTCSISDTIPAAGQYRVVWLLGGTAMAVWEPSGVVTLREFSSSGAEGRLVVRRRDLASWVLRISRVRIEDGGVYVCEVIDERSKKSRLSMLASVEVTQQEFRAPQVSLSALPSRLYEGDPLVCRCRVSASSSSSASLGWFRKVGSGDWIHIASMLPDGQLLIGADYRRRHDEAQLSAEKTNFGLFTLRLDDVTQSDGGEYVCRYTEETQDHRGDPRNRTTDSNGVQTDIQLLGSALQVSLMTRNSTSLSGGSAVLRCDVRADVGLSGRRLGWSWFFRPDTDRQGPFRSLVQGSGNGELTWGDSYSGFKDKAQISLSGVSSTLSIRRVQRAQQSGTYYCSVAVLSGCGGGTLVTLPSNHVTIKVQLPGMKLRLDSAPGAPALTAGQDEAAVTCRILERTPGTELSLAWYFRSPSSPSPLEILQVDRGGVTIQDASLRPRFIAGRSSADSFLLRILRPGLRDAGAYHCAGQEWLLEETGNWTQLGERKSGDAEITFTDSDQSLKLSKQDVSSSVQQGEDLVLHCPLEAGPGPTSLLSISWFKQGRGLHPPRLLYSSNQEGVTEYKDSRLRLVVPRRGNYSLVLQGAGQEDEGRYFCQAEEWGLQEGGWKMAASDQSGSSQIRVTPPEILLSLNVTELTLVFPEHSTVTLPCQVLAVTLPSSLLSVSWWKAGGPGAPDTLLFGVSHTGEFIYPSEKDERLQYERPQGLTFHLKIRPGHMTDSGTYHCRVQEWLPSPRGAWEPIGERQSGHASITVQAAGFRSEICTPPPLFHLLLAFTVLFIILVLGLVALALWRRRGGGAQRRFRGALWNAVKMREVATEDGGQTRGTDDRTTPRDGNLDSQ